MKAYSDYAWWTKDDPSDSIYSAYSMIKESQEERVDSLKRHARMYSNQHLLGFGPGTHFRMASKERVTLNVIKNVTDTIVSRIGKHNPRPRFLTSAGNFTLKRKAKLLQQWTDAQYISTGLFEIGPQVLLDACVFGTGVFKIYPCQHEDTIDVDRVFPGELFIDPAEGMYGKPQQIFQCKYFPKEVLKGMFPGKEAEIDKAKRLSRDEEIAYHGDSICEMLEVVEAWKLPCGKDMDGGKHAIAIDGATLFVEPWERHCLPFVFLHWSRPLRGFWGIGLAEELTGIQIEINRLLQKIQKAFHLLANPQVWVEAGSNIKTTQLNNEVGSVYRYVGQRPVVVSPQTIHPELFQHLENLYSKAYEIAGVSRMSAGSLKPAGLESGVALREYHDIETERFAIVSKSYEKAFMDITEQLVDSGKYLANRNPRYSVVAKKDRNTIAEIKWKDVNLDEDSYVLQIFPSSALPTTPTGRLAMVQDMLQSGLLDPETGKRLLDFPDLEERLALDSAVSDNIDRVIERMLDDGEYEAPEPFQDLQLSLKKVQAAYNKASLDGVPESNLALLRQYMAAVHELMKRAVQEAMNQSMQPAPGAPPAPGPTGAPPTAVTPQDGNVMM